MVFPEYIKKGDTIGVTAPSNGIVDELKVKRFHNAVSNLKKVGYDVLFTDNVFTADKRGCSSAGDVRAKEFGNLIKDENVGAIVCAAGGDYLMEMLDYIDFEAIKQNPKWIQGYSDITTLIFPITTKCDVATVYGFNFSDFGMKQWQDSVVRGLEVLEGKRVTQESFDFHEDFHGFDEDEADNVNDAYDGNDEHEADAGNGADTGNFEEAGLEGYSADAPVVWKTYNDKPVTMSGRLLGGCLDCISFLAGTKYDGTLEFAEKYKEDGIIWFLESFDMSDTVLVTTLWKLKQMGYFKYASGFVFGRPLMYNTWIEQSYEDAVMSVLGDLDVPVIFDADIGHKGPQFSMINGAKAVVKSEDGKGVITYVRA
ncbi:MAG: LD-carboxypeptidase [Lachnospiraceae bacterium]|nr:LD-carboxypeptidase [Lachnospiraceae bacterium]